MRKLALLLLLCLPVLQVLAQNRTVTGLVTDEKGSPLVNVTVLAKGTRKGVTTDDAGRFSINLPQGVKALSISSVGYQLKEVALDENKSYTVVLTGGPQNLDEIVVTAYGATKKKAFTGTASTIGADKFKDLQVTSLTSVLQGNASGVIAVTSNGQPGENPTIRVRGIGSVNASADPLIILDGAEYGGNIGSINPNDIESITILKDANSTALYGSRAANGVLNITTKSGKGDPRVSVNALTGWSTRAVKDYDYASSQQIYELTWEALRNQAQLTPSLLTSNNVATAEAYATKVVAGTLVYNPFRNSQPIGTDGKLKAGLTPLWNENWTDALLRTGKRQQIDLSMTGGSDRTRYLFSTGVLNDDGLAIQSNFKRYTGRFKVDTKVNKWLNAGANTNLVYTNQNYPNQTGSAYANVIGWIRGASSLFPVYLRDTATGNFILDGKGAKQYDYGNNGQLTRRYGNGSNPVGTTYQNPVSYDRFTTSLNAYAEAQIINGLKFRTQYALDYYQYGSNVYYNPFVGDGAAYAGRSNKSRETVTKQTFTNTLTYDKTFGKHHLNALAGFETVKTHDGWVTAEARGFTFAGVTELAYGSTPYTATSGAYDNRLESYFGRINYDFADKYHISGSYRRDASTRFADSVRWDGFYSVGGAWNINKESFLSRVTVINDLKLRASYGTTGNQLFTSGNGNLYFPYLSTYAAGANIAGYSGSYINSIGNGSLTWEKQKMFDLGIDFAILKNRISGSFTYFNRVSDRLLFSRPLAPSASGGLSVNDNIGKLRNRGVEMDLTTVNMSNRNFQWSTTFNLSHVNNKIIELPQNNVAGSNYTQLTVGQPVINFYMREYAGVDLNDGRPLWYMDKTDAASGKVTKDTTHTYSAATRYFKGSPLPNWTGGVNNSFRYKDIDLNFLVSYSIGGKIYDGDYGGLMYGTVGNTAGQNWSTDIENRWQSKTNPGDGKTPRLTTTTDYQSNSASTRFLFDASYLRVRNITLGYHIPQSLLKKAKFSDARVYVDWQNPITVFGRKGLDPEAGLNGVTSNTTTVYKTISIGLNFNF